MAVRSWHQGRGDWYLVDEQTCGQSNGVGSDEKVFLILPAPSAPSAPAKAKEESIQLWDRVHFREIVSAPYLHLLLPRVVRT